MAEVDGFKLGCRLAKRRVERNANALPADRITQLCFFGIIWSPNRNCKRFAGTDHRDDHCEQ